MTKLAPLSAEPSCSGDAILQEGESLRPLEDYMFVQRHMGDEQIGQFFVPAKYREASCHGVVIATGPGQRVVRDDGTPTLERVPMEVAVGDTVMWDGGTGINHREYRKGSGVIIAAQRDVLFVAREVDDESWYWEDHEPGGSFFAGPDRDGFWPVGKHLPKWLKERIEEVNAEPIRISDQTKREAW